MTIETIPPTYSENKIKALNTAMKICLGIGFVGCLLTLPLTGVFLAPVLSPGVAATGFLAVAVIPTLVSFSISSNLEKIKSDIKEYQNSPISLIDGATSTTEKETVKIVGTDENDGHPPQ